MSKTVLTVKTDADVKRGAQNVAREMGIPLSTVVNAYLKEFVRSRSVTFSTEPRLRPHIVKLFEDAEKEPIQSPKNSRIFDTPDAAIAYLEKHMRT